MSSLRFPDKVFLQVHPANQRVSTREDYVLRIMYLDSWGGTNIHNVAPSTKTCQVFLFRHRQPLSLEFGCNEVVWCHDLGWSRDQDHSKGREKIPILHRRPEHNTLLYVAPILLKGKNNGMSRGHSEK